MNTELEIVIHDIMRDQSIPGMAIAMIRDGEIEYSRGFGEVSNKSNIGVNANTLFMASSMTKTLVAAAVLQLSEMGELELHAPVSHFLSSLDMRDRRYSHITVAQLLSHTAGMPVNFPSAEPEDAPDPIVQTVFSLTNEQLISPPGHEFHYSDIGYDVLGALIAERSGTRFEDFIQEHFLGPLDMKQTRFGPLTSEVEVALPHISKEEPGLALAPNNQHAFAGSIGCNLSTEDPAHAPSGGSLYTTVNDWSQWMMLLLNKGRWNDMRLLSQQSLDFLWAPVKSLPPSSAYKAVTNGWFVREHRTQRIVEHHSADRGYGCMSSLIPEAGLGVVVLSNFQWTSSTLAANACMDTLLGMEPKPVSFATA